MIGSRPLSLSNPAQWLQIVAAIVVAAALTAVLVLGIERADQLQAATATLRLASELSAKPQTIRADLTLIQRELETTAYLGDALRSLAQLRAANDSAFHAIQNNLRNAGLLADADVASALSVSRSSWHSLDQALQELEHDGSSGLYSDTPTGSELSATGKAAKALIDRLLASETKNLDDMSSGLVRLGSMLQIEVDENGRNLRTLLLAGSSIAAVLLALMLYYAWRWRQSAQAARVAQRQVTNILGTVREGLFLIGRDLTVGEICSDSLRDLLRVEVPPGSQFRDLLAPLVDEKTLTAALKFLGLLWKEKVHEDLIESVNPLSQIEASFPNPRGGTDVRYLAFSFRRVRAATGDDSVLGVVADITDRVLLARELEQVRADSGSQAALLLQLLRADQEQLQLFTVSADVALRKSNAMLTAPGIEQQDLKNKLNGVFRELHAIKGEAAALGLTTFAQRIHLIEDMLQGLRTRSALSGNDFVPVVVKLDELINHLGQMQSLQERVLALRTRRAASGATGPEGAQDPEDSHRITTVLPAATASPAAARTPAPQRALPGGSSAAVASLEEALRVLAEQTAKAVSCAVQLRTAGLERVPAQYALVVRNICIQMIRNSVVHGIEGPEERRALGKPEHGVVQISFAEEGPESDGGYRLTIEDDGRGLRYEGIVDKALRSGMVSPQQAATLDRSAVYRMIFQPGFSTTEEITEHAGRGVGLDAVSTLVREHGGKIGVSTMSGRYTRFRVMLPRIQSVGASSAA
jgi:HPt (histidine-containing phosphotransfer) domain-containing protein